MGFLFFLLPVPYADDGQMKRFHFNDTVGVMNIGDFTAGIALIVSFLEFS